MLIEFRQRDVREQRREDPACGVPVTVSSKPACSHDPGPQERLDERQHALVPDPPTHPAHQSRVVDAVEARLDVRLNYPLVVAGS